MGLLASGSEAVPSGLTGLEDSFVSAAAFAFLLGPLDLLDVPDSF